MPLLLLKRAFSAESSVSCSFICTFIPIHSKIKSRDVAECKKESSSARKNQIDQKKKKSGWCTGIPRVSQVGGANMPMYVSVVPSLCALMYS